MARRDASPVGAEAVPAGRPAARGVKMASSGDSRAFNAAHAGPAAGLRDCFLGVVEVLREKLAPRVPWS